MTVQVETKFDHVTLSVEAKLSDNEQFVGAERVTLSIQTPLEIIDLEIASLLAIRTFLVVNEDVVKLSHTRDKVSLDVFKRNYPMLNDDSKAAVDRIIKAEGLAKIDN